MRASDAVMRCRCKVILSLVQVGRIMPPVSLATDRPRRRQAPGDACRFLIKATHQETLPMGADRILADHSSGFDRLAPHLRRRLEQEAAEIGIAVEELFLGIRVLFLRLPAREQLQIVRRHYGAAGLQWEDLEPLVEELGDDVREEIDKRRIEARRMNPR
jgi:hypothetical protein